MRDARAGDKSASYILSDSESGDDALLSTTLHDLAPQPQDDGELRGC